MTQNIKFRIVDSLAEVNPAAWNALVDGDNPFLRYQFLYALEQSGCTSKETGWQPRHLLVEQDGLLIAGVPLYLKHHSYGEYVFDWAWADAYQRAGLAYYPKLISAVPFTPVSGPRILSQQPVEQALTEAIKQAILELAAKESASSVHWLFPHQQQADALVSENSNKAWLRRTDCQFHWQNSGYADFDAFIEEFSAKKRKNVRRERRRISETEIQVETLSGAELTPEHWDFFYRCYQHTTATHGAHPYLNRQFFELIGNEMADACVLFLASRSETPIASALCFKGTNSLYGRYWGAIERQENLHFELCYYAPIEYCIQQGLSRFEAGAQGPHKLSRGFLPTTTHSVHWLADSRFSNAVDDYLQHERGDINRHMELLNQHSPFRQAP